MEGMSTNMLLLDTEGIVKVLSTDYLGKVLA